MIIENTTTTPCIPAEEVWRLDYNERTQWREQNWQIEEDSIMTEEEAVDSIQNGDRKNCYQVLAQYAQAVPPNVVIAAFQKFGTSMMTHLPPCSLSKAVILDLVRYYNAPIISIAAIANNEVGNDPDISIMIDNAQKEIDEVRRRIGVE